MQINNNTSIQFKSTESKELKTKRFAQLVLKDITVVLRPSPSFENNQKSTGSSKGWLGLHDNDVLLFNENGALATLQFKLPEFEIEISNSGNFFNRQKEYADLLYSENIDFSLEAKKYRTFLEDENLILAHNDFNLTLENISEYKISANISIFERDNEYFAWGMYSPYLYLAADYSAQNKWTNESLLKDSFLEAINLFEYEKFELLEDHNEDYIRKISELHNRIVADDSNNGLTILSDWLFEVCENYYWDTDLMKYFDT